MDKETACRDIQWLDFHFNQKNWKFKKKKVFFIVVNVISQGEHCQNTSQIHTTKALRMHHSLSTFNQVTTVTQYYSKNHTMVNLQKFSLRLIKSPLKRAQGNVSVIYMQGQTYLKSIMKCIHKCLFEVLFALIHLKKKCSFANNYVQTCNTWIPWNWA